VPLCQAVTFPHAFHNFSAQSIALHDVFNQLGQKQLINVMTVDRALIGELSQLKKSEKLILVEALWDSIASDPSDVEVPDHHKAIIEERLKTLEKDKKTGSSWEKIRPKYL